ncbi:MAG: hypothetical protein ACPGRD_01110 [Planktomarina sp.]
MTKNWILDVMADLRTFAQSNDLPLLASQLDDAVIVAMTELASLEGCHTSLNGWDDGTKSRAIDGTFGGSIGTC